jgi:hypothetical protein
MALGLWPLLVTGQVGGQEEDGISWPQGEARFHSAARVHVSEAHSVPSCLGYRLASSFCVLVVETQ